MAGLIPTATQYNQGLMPIGYTRYNTGGGSLDMNECKDLWRLYSTINGSNAPANGYIGFFNIGYNIDWFIQIACVVQTGGGKSIWYRCFHSGKNWSAWGQMV